MKNIVIPDTIKQLQEQNMKLHTQVAELTAKVIWYEEQIRSASVPQPSQS